MRSYEPKNVASTKVIDENIKDEHVEDEGNNIKVKNIVKKDYLGIIEIPKIGLKRYLYDTTSAMNDVDKNIEIIDGSSMPNIYKGNFILAAHNGNTSVGYFRNLHKLSLGDEVIINYNDVDYVYEIAKKYDVLKTGKVAIKRDKTRTSITLITCFGSDRQLVVIGYLK